ncbi:2,3-diaminopropionate biosynthesis protein SbnB [Burkholderia sp. LMG 21824]|uniref:2,3-diaminopropionate biosynthesis protein SbnB n=1 Tax=Burkholderia sp. LMG 21824 TaxID=3158172 RepID=UPI003C30002C
MRDDHPCFSVISGDFIEAILSETKPQIIDLVQQGYLLHHHRKTINPDSYFLRFDDKPEARIIALPAAVRDLDGGLSVSGIKWIGSYPRNIDVNLQRASAVVILNDYETGYPFACLEASQISAARTAASAVLATRHLHGDGKRARSLSVIGAGVIARTILAYFDADDWQFDDVCVHDLSTSHRDAFVRNVGKTSRWPVRSASLGDALDASIVVLATTAAAPWIDADHSWRADQVVLNVSLRDLPPETILGSNNVLDDVDHCMKANTSPHLAFQRYGHRDFVNGTLAQIIEGEARLDTKKPTIFSPFGLGLLDLCVSMFLYRQGVEKGKDYAVPNFFPNTERWSR